MSQYIHWFKTQNASRGTETNISTHPKIGVSLPLLQSNYKYWGNAFIQLLTPPMFLPVPGLLEILKYKEREPAYSMLHMGVYVLSLL